MNWMTKLLLRSSDEHKLTIYLALSTTVGGVYAFTRKRDPLGSSIKVESGQELC